MEGIQVGAVDLRFVANARVSRNMIKGASAFGVYSASSSGEIRDNHIRGAGVGVWLDDSSHTAVAKNRVRTAATWGIALQNDSTDISVSRNVITESGEYDLLWDETGDGNQWSRNRCETSSPAGLCEP